MTVAAQLCHCKSYLWVGLLVGSEQKKRQKGGKKVCGIKLRLCSGVSSPSSPADEHQVWLKSLFTPKMKSASKAKWLRISNEQDVCVTETLWTISQQSLAKLRHKAKVPTGTTQEEDGSRPRVASFRPNKKTKSELLARDTYVVPQEICCQKRQGGTGRNTSDSSHYFSRLTSQFMDDCYDRMVKPIKSDAQGCVLCGLARTGPQRWWWVFTWKIMLLTSWNMTTWSTKPSWTSAILLPLQTSSMALSTGCLLTWLWAGWSLANPPLPYGKCWTQFDVFFTSLTQTACIAHALQGICG